MSEKKIDLGDFCFWNFYFTIVCFFVYKRTLFRPIGDLDATASFVVLISFLIFWNLLVIWSGIWRYTGFTIVCNIALEYGVYAAVSYYWFGKNTINIILCITIILIILYAILLFGRNIKAKNKRKRKRIFFGRFRKAVVAFHFMLGIALSLVLLYLIASVFSGKVEAAEIRKENQRLIEARNQEIKKRKLPTEREAVLSLQKKTWNGLSKQERLAVVQRIAVIEQKRLGLQMPIIVQTEKLKEEHLGYYVHSDYQMVINEDLLMSDDTGYIINTICHEMQHSFQHWLTEVSQNSDADQKLQIFDEAMEYEENFAHYISGDSEDFEAYYSQKCEKDARSYGEKAVDRYSELLEKYLNGHVQEQDG